MNVMHQTVKRIGGCLGGLMLVCKWLTSTAWSRYKIMLERASRSLGGLLKHRLRHLIPRAYDLVGLDGAQ